MLGTSTCTTLIFESCHALLRGNLTLRRLKHFLIASRFSCGQTLLTSMACMLTSRVIYGKYHPEPHKEGVQSGLY